MSEFDIKRTALRDSRDTHEKASTELYASNQYIQMLEKELETLQRTKGDNNPQFLDKQQALKNKLTTAKDQQAIKQTAFNSANTNLNQVLQTFEIFVDPRTQLTENFSNTTPFLLFPLRIETRFKTVNNKKQLWIRVYPDECMVDSFEELLSVKEVSNAARFWSEYYSAGAVADPNNPDPVIVERQKAAWRLLVKLHGDGRSAWITRNLVPEPESVFPIRGDKTHILAIATGSWPTNAAEQTAITGLFSDMWKANGDEAVITQLKTDFNTNHAPLNADEVIAAYMPGNFDEDLPLGLSRSEAVLAFAIVIFKDLDTKAGKEQSWSQASRARLLPERLAVIRVLNNETLEPIFGKLIPHVLPTSPDPSSDPSEQFRQSPEGDLIFADAVKWVADFETAVNIGMGFIIDLEPAHENGFDELYVLGVCLRYDHTEGAKQLTELFDHHYFSKKGFSIVSQGTPTNNTETADAGFSTGENADRSFDPYFNKVDQFTNETTWTKKRDGQWLAEHLGLNPDTFKKVLNAGGQDQSDARNMNIALWPATLGYVMESLMQDGFSQEVQEMTRGFFSAYVSGRGPVPAIRVGNQPYGILPTAAFDRIAWLIRKQDGNVITGVGGSNQRFLQSLYLLLRQLDEYWFEMSADADHVLQTKKSAGRSLLDVIGLHPASVEFHRRYLESLIIMKSNMSLVTPAYSIYAEEVAKTVELLQTLGYGTTVLPQMAVFAGMEDHYKIQHVVDDVPLSETTELRKYTADNTKNYIEALIDQARKSASAIRTGEGFDKMPEAELYRLLKYALELGYYDSSLRVAATSQAFPASRITAMRVESPVVHQRWNGELTESRYALMYSTIPDVSPNLAVSELVRDALIAPVVASFATYLDDQVKAMEALKNASTARLERAFVEHLDSCAYRLDAWKTGLLHYQLSLTRNNLPEGTQNVPTPGIYLGAFGMLQNVRPEKRKVLTQQTVPQDLKDDFNKDDKQVYFKDSANEGYIHAPSQNQAVTAAVLRNGYISDGRPNGNEVMAVNLSSERIRLALSVLEGIQGGQSLAALLGYKLERLLHDRSDLTFAGVDRYIYALRKAFPLNADQIKDTKSTSTTDPSVDPETIPITAIEARNVVHGVNLANHVKSQPNFPNVVYPFGLTLISASDPIKAAIKDAILEIIDIADAVADLGVAESVHHIIAGNYDRAAGVLDSYTKGNYPQHPDVIRTPRSGPTLTHRIGIPMQFISAAAAGSNPRVTTEPSVNQWLTAILPNLNNIVCSYSYFRRADNTHVDEAVSMTTLGLAPLDLLHLLSKQDTRSFNELDERIIHYVQINKDPKLDQTIVINYTAQPTAANTFSFFELMPLLSSLRALLLESAPLIPTDMVLPNEAGSQDEPVPELPEARVQQLINDLDGAVDAAEVPTGILTYIAGLAAIDTATPVQLDDMRAKADDTIDRFATFMASLAKFGIPQTGFLNLYDQRQTWFTEIKRKLTEIKDRWQSNDSQYTILSANPTPTPEELRTMERLISVSPTPESTITIGSVQAKKLLFDAEFTKVKNVLNDRQPTLKKLFEDVATLDTAPYDLAPLDISAEMKQVPIFVSDLQARAASLKEDLLKRIDAAQKLLNELAPLAAADKVKQVEAAAKIILGDGFRMVPRFVLPADQQAELQNAWTAEGALLNYLKTDPLQQRLNPKEDWLHGIARVHPKMYHLENCLVMREAFNLDENALGIHAVQLPYKSTDYHWLAMPFPEDQLDLEEGNILLFTAFVAQAATTPTEVCGVLAHEWTEVIPAREEITGISFHYDRPSTEAPQSILLVTPTNISGGWQWDDLSDALRYTLKAARSRAVEPLHIDESDLARLLPALISAESYHPYSIVLNNKAHYLVQQ